MRSSRSRCPLPQSGCRRDPETHRASRPDLIRGLPEWPRQRPRHGAHNSVNSNACHAAMIDRTVAQHARPAEDGMDQHVGHHTLLTTLPLASGDVTRSSVGPKMATTGTPSAAARCMAPESFDTNAAHLLMAPASRREIGAPDQVHRADVWRQRRFYLTAGIAVVPGAKITHATFDSRDNLTIVSTTIAVAIALRGRMRLPAQSRCNGCRRRRASEAVGREQCVRPRERRRANGNTRARVDRRDVQALHQIKVIGGLMLPAARPGDRSRQQPSPKPCRVAPALRNRRAAGHHADRNELGRSRIASKLPARSACTSAAGSGARSRYQARRWSLRQRAARSTESRPPRRARRRRLAAPPPSPAAPSPHPRASSGADDQAPDAALGHSTNASRVLRVVSVVHVIRVIRVIRGCPPRSTRRETFHQSGRPSPRGRASGGASTATVPGSAARHLEDVGAALGELTDRVGIVGSRRIDGVLVDHAKPAAQRQRKHRHDRRTGPQRQRGEGRRCGRPKKST